MAVIYREIASLKSLILELKLRDINRFHSVNEINLFFQQYSDEKKNIMKNVELEINREISIKHQKVQEYKKILKSRSEKLSHELINTINLYNKKLFELKLKNTKTLFRFFYAIKQSLITKRLNYLKTNFNKIIEQKTRGIANEIRKNQDSINNITQNKEFEIISRSRKEIEKLTYIFSSLQEFKPLILGAVGENLVAKELEKLPNNYILINDFKLNFNKPIYDKRNKDRIYSIQIDHLLVAPAGIFIIETKNWSNKSIYDSNFKSPVKQIQRASFALFIFLNNIIDDLKNIGKHRWGESQVPIKNLIVMINNKPKKNFKFVKILLLNELTRYITYFDKIYSTDEVKRIADILLYYNEYVVK